MIPWYAIIFTMNKQAILRDLQKIPGVGKSISEDLFTIDIHSVKELRGKNPENLYRELCKKQGVQIDRCMLYVLRCAVYYASHEKPKKESLLWWNWKD